MDLHKLWDQKFWPGAKSFGPLAVALLGVRIMGSNPRIQAQYGFKNIRGLGRNLRNVASNASSLFDKGDRDLDLIYNPEQSNSSFSTSLQT